MRLLILTILVLRFPILSTAQSVQWAFSLGDTIGIHEESKLDSLGNVYIAGGFRDGVDFDPGVGTEYHYSYDNWGAYLAKYDPFGMLVWVKPFFCSEGFGVRITSIGIDGNNQPIFTGNFEGSIDLDPGIGTNLISDSLGDGNSFMVKLDANGNYLWGNQLKLHFPIDLETDFSDEIYLTGAFWDSLDFDPGGGSTVLIDSGLTSAFISHYDSIGNFVNVFNLKSMVWGGSASQARSVAIDREKNQYLCGQFQGKVDFDPSPSTYLLESNSSAGFIAKYDSLNNLLWANVVGDFARFCEPDQSGNLYVSGFFYGTTDINPDTTLVQQLVSKGQSDWFLVSYDSEGNLRWGHGFGGIYEDRVAAMAVDNSGNIFLTGRVESDSVDFDPSQSSFFPSPSGDSTVVVAKYDSSGNFGSLFHFSNTPIGEEWASFVGIDQFGHIYLAGEYSDSVDIAPGSSTMWLPGGGQSNVFVIKYAQIGLDLLPQIIGPPRIFAFPNPCNQEFNVVIPRDLRPQNWSLHSCDGRRIDHGDFGGRESISIPTGAYIEGGYFFTISFPSGARETIKFIVKR